MLRHGKWASLEADPDPHATNNLISTFYFRRNASVKISIQDKRQLIGARRLLPCSAPANQDIRTTTTKNGLLLPRDPTSPRLCICALAYSRSLTLELESQRNRKNLGICSWFVGSAHDFQAIHWRAVRRPIVVIPTDVICPATRVGNPNPTHAPSAPSLPSSFLCR